MKHVHDCLSARKDRESSFHYCRSTAKFVQPCLYAVKPDKAVLTSEKVL